MLSILIPVYNYRVDDLVEDLRTQCSNLGITYEILLCDDGSGKVYSEIIHRLADQIVVFDYRFETNQGRVLSRKKLTELARYDYCLFLDCDAQILHDDFIKRYIDCLNQADIIIGGHIYSAEIPDIHYRLHWKYGWEVEARESSERQVTPYRSFSTFNFLAKKSVIWDYWDRIDINGYGHEDTLLGYFFKMDQVSIKHIENAALHLGIKSTKVFLEDQQSAIRNAFKVADEYPNIDVSLIQTVKRLQHLRLSELVRKILKFGLGAIKSNLLGKNPKIWALQLFKLLYALDISKT